MRDHDLEDLLRYYSDWGLADWSKKARGTLKMDANACLRNKIAENPRRVKETLTTRFDGTNADKLYFIPMPDHPSSRDFVHSFFVPIRGEDDDMAFDLFLLAQGMNGLAFRFESANPTREGETHDYAHVQMCRRMLRNSLSVKTLNWVPEHYPAFPTRASSSAETFLTMATAVHGRSNGLVYVLEEIGRKGRALLAQKYIHLLHSMLG
jgi:hypothetical protein